MLTKADALLHLPNLEVLELGNNELQRIPLDIDGLRRLRELVLWSNPIEHYPASLGNMRSLERLDLMHNVMTAEEITAVQLWANPLRAANLSDLPPTIIGTAGFDPIRDQGNAFAQRLKNSGNQVTHHCFKHLTHSFLMFGRVSREAETACLLLADNLSPYLQVDEA